MTFRSGGARGGYRSIPDLVLNRLMIGRSRCQMRNQICDHSPGQVRGQILLRLAGRGKSSMSRCVLQ